MIAFIPYARGQVVLDCSSKEFTAYIREATEKGFDIFRFADESPKSYERQFFDEGEVDLAKVRSGSQNLRTIIHGAYHEKGELLVFKYRIVFSFWSLYPVLIVIFFLGSIVLGLIDFIQSKSVNSSFIWMSILSYAFLIFVFNSNLRDDLEFLNRMKQVINDRNKIDDVND